MKFEKEFVEFVKKDRPAEDAEGMLDLLKKLERVLGSNLDYFLMYEMSIWHVLRMLDNVDRIMLMPYPLLHGFADNGINHENARIVREAFLLYDKVHLMSEDRLLFGCPYAFPEHEVAKERINKPGVIADKIKLIEAKRERQLACEDNDEMTFDDKLEVMFSDDDIMMMCDIAYAYEFGDGVEQDQEEADYWRCEAILASVFDGSAEYHIGSNYYYIAANEDYFGIAAWYFRRAIMSENAWDVPKGLAALRLAELHIVWNVDNDDDAGVRKAIQNYELAAACGISEAKYRLGCLYEEGDDAYCDKNKAMKWYVDASSEGCGGAKYKYAKALELGQCVDKDEAKAFALYGEVYDALKSDESSIDETLEDVKLDAVALALSNMYRDGRGVEKDVGRADALLRENLQRKLKAENK